MTTALPPHPQVLTFQVGGIPMAVPIDIVREVTRLPSLARVPLTRVPCAPPALLGLANLRGRAIPVLSVAALLDPLADSTPDAAAHLVIVDIGEVLGMVVDTVGLVGVHDANGAALPLDIAELIARVRPPPALGRSRPEPAA